MKRKILIATHGKLASGFKDALKIIIENTKPTPNAPLNTGFTMAGKNNKLVVKKLLKVVINDVELEISYTMDYVKYLDKELSRFKKIDTYIQRKNSATKKNDILYYEQYIDKLLRHDESLDNLYN